MIVLSVRAGCEGCRSVFGLRSFAPAFGHACRASGKLVAPPIVSIPDFRDFEASRRALRSGRPARAGPAPTCGCFPAPLVETHADRAGRIAGDDFVRADILRDDAARPDHGTVADPRHAGQNDRVRSDPDVVADFERRPFQHVLCDISHDRIVQNRVSGETSGRVIGPENPHAAGDRAIIAERYVRRDVFRVETAAVGSVSDSDAVCLGIQLPDFGRKRKTSAATGDDPKQYSTCMPVFQTSI